MSGVLALVMHSYEGVIGLSSLYFQSDEACCLN